MKSQNEGMGSWRYSVVNPPPDEEKASERISFLEADIAKIETRLDVTKPDEFASEAEYKSWRRRITTGLGYTTAEVKYLQGWQAAQQQSLKQSVTENLEARARELQATVRASYTQLYDTNNPPENIVTAQTRKTLLATLIAQIETVATEIMGIWAEYGFSNKLPIKVREPLQALRSPIRLEMSVLDAYIHMVHQNTRTDWRGICAGALARAVAEGFVLTPVEQATLEGLRPYIKSE